MVLPNKKPLVAHSEFYQKRKKQIVKIFKGFRDDEKLIKKFENSPSIPGANIICFDFYLYNCTDRFNVKINKSSIPSLLRTSLKTSSNLEVFMGDDKTIKNLRAHLRDFILKRMFGIFVEMKFFQQVNDYDDFGIRVQKSTSEEDRKGIDFWIYFQDSVVPLQIKTSGYSQEKHKEKFPTIPSLVYMNKKYSDSELYRTLFEICLEYREGNILHVNELIKKDKFAKSLE